MNVPIIGIVGPCASGKSTLIARLRAAGYPVKHIAQEHSYVPAMWQLLAKPDVLVYLHVSYPTSMQRRKLNWKPAEHEEQLHRLRHARQHAHLIIDTDPLTPEEVFARVAEFLQQIN